ncbi:hypothetical protein WN51_09522 [Melipona quadrifasciata]|uniref:Uncharacterized protein n=1 Tax=Melipona quadrifasciata TaxID=166423 RepID=A0A0M9A8L7_9HYME|nr:hypothetical protein WN51_09522 [Melipona quadrifasciata]
MNLSNKAKAFRAHSPQSSARATNPLAPSAWKRDQGREAGSQPSKPGSQARQKAARVPLAFASPVWIANQDAKRNVPKRVALCTSLILKLYEELGQLCVVNFPRQDFIKCQNTARTHLKTIKQFSIEILFLNYSPFLNKFFIVNCHVQESIVVVLLIKQTEAHIIHLEQMSQTLDDSAPTPNNERTGKLRLEWIADFGVDRFLIRPSFYTTDEITSHRCCVFRGYQSTPITVIRSVLPSITVPKLFSNLPARNHQSTDYGSRRSTRVECEENWTNCNESRGLEIRSGGLNPRNRGKKGNGEVTVTPLLKNEGYDNETRSSCQRRRRKNQSRLKPSELDDSKTAKHPEAQLSIAFPFRGKKSKEEVKEQKEERRGKQRRELWLIRNALDNNAVWQLQPPLIASIHNLWHDVAIKISNFTNLFGRNRSEVCYRSQTAVNALNVGYDLNVDWGELDCTIHRIFSTNTDFARVTQNDTNQTETNQLLDAPVCRSNNPHGNAGAQRRASKEEGQWLASDGDPEEGIEEAHATPSDKEDCEQLVRSGLIKDNFATGDNPELGLFRCNADATKISDWLIWVTQYRNVIVITPAKLEVCTARERFTTAASCRDFRYLTPPSLLHDPTKFRWSYEISLHPHDLVASVPATCRTCWKYLSEASILILLKKRHYYAFATEIAHSCTQHSICQQSEPILCSPRTQSTPVPTTLGLRLASNRFESNIQCVLPGN